MVQEQLKVAEVQVSYKPDYKASERPKITSSKQAYDLLIQQWDFLINIFSKTKIIRPLLFTSLQLFGKKFNLRQKNVSLSETSFYLNETDASQVLVAI